MRFFRDSLKRDVEWLLNTRQPPLAEIARREVSKATVINYGLPDITSLALMSSSDQRSLRSAIEACLRNFEPRLTDVHVTLQSTDTTDRRLRFHIEGNMKLDPAPEEIAFDTVLELFSGEYKVKRAMREELLEYYERELAYLRQLGGKCAEKYPRVASRLLLEPDRCDDPHVERLLEGFAFMAARIHLRVDDDFPEVTSALLITAAVGDGARRVAALNDSQRRPAGQIRGRKGMWAGAMALVSSAGVVPVSYFVLGQRREP